jgi:glycosyltransferase involved in cell wall biosynthesis
VSEARDEFGVQARPAPSASNGRFGSGAALERPAASSDPLRLVASSRRLKIALVAPPYFPVPPLGYGGIERVVAVLAEELVRRGHDVTVFGAASSTTPAHLVAPLASPPRLGDPLSLADDLYHTTVAYLQAGRFDVVHDHTSIGPSLGALLNGHPPVVHTLHGPWTPSSKRLFALLHERLELVAISHAQRRANPLLRYAGVIHNGIDLAAHPLRASKEDFVTFLGRVNPEKRPEEAIEIARRAKLPIVLIVKRSEPAEQAYWDEVVASHLGPDVEVFDQPPHEVKVELIGRSRAMLFPIDWPEPFGLVMAEAMACGTPVIARRLGAAPEVIDDGVTGYLCDSLDEMVVALDAARRLSASACRRRVEREFSATAMAERYERVYEAALERSRLGAGIREQSTSTSASA